MAKYILKRIVYIFCVLFIVVTITFFMIHSIPGDPLGATVEDMPEATRQLYYARYGYDQPLYIQYFRFLRQLAHGDLGTSIRYSGRSVSRIITDYAPVSALIGGLALLVGFVAGVLLGILAALRHGKVSDKLITVVAILGTTLPIFVIASLLQYIFTVRFHLLPTTGWKGPRYMILPMICMAVGPLATYARYMRSSMLEVANQDYILVAEAKGLTQGQIVWHHMVRNAFLPIVTMLCGSVAGIFSGSFIVEKVFAIPGIGRYFITAMNDRDYSIVLGLNIFFTAIYLISVLVSDILLVILDPRIRLEGNKA